MYGSRLAASPYLYDQSSGGGGIEFLVEEIPGPRSLRAVHILREAEVQKDGKHLGPFGGPIVVKVFIGLLQGDALS
jgi:hypothetical protein